MCAPDPQERGNGDRSNQDAKVFCHEDLILNTLQLTSSKVDNPKHTKTS